MSGSRLCISRNGTVISKTKLYCSVSQLLHSYICERFIYFQDRSAYSAVGKYVDQSWEYINCSQIHECGNWDWGRTIPRKGIHKWDFPCSVLEIWFMNEESVGWCSWWLPPGGSGGRPPRCPCGWAGEPPHLPTSISQFHDVRSSCYSPYLD